MKGLFRYLFVVQYNYRDSVQTTRARVVLPLISSVAVLGLVFGLFLVIASITGLELRTSAASLGSTIALALLVWSVSVVWMFAWNLQQALARTAQVAARTRATAATGQAISRLLNVNELLTTSVDLIRDRFALYQVQILMADETRSYANLSASTGEVGHVLLTQGYRVPINSRTAVGESIITGELRYVRDLRAATYQLPDPLAECRSELIIPLNAGEEVVGALDILSTRSGAFGEEDIEAMRIVANQISQGLQNARLFETQQRNLLQNRRLFLESETNLREIERLNQQLTGQSWRQYLAERHDEKFGVHIVGNAAQSDEVDWTPAMRLAVERGRAISQDNDDGQTLAMPVVIRGQPVGAIEVKLPPQSVNQAEVRNIVQAIIERLAFSLENIRLFEQAQMAAEREQHISRMTAQLQGLTSVEDILTTAVSTLGQVLNADQGLIRLVGYEAISSDQAHAGSPPLPSISQSGHASTETIIPGTVTSQKGRISL